MWIFNPHRSYIERPPSYLQMASPAAVSEKMGQNPTDARGFLSP